jgi:outer membrane receptor protein involved in Fe transport
MDMRKFTSYLVTMVLANIFTMAAFAQNVTISGTVKNMASGENAAAVSVTIKGSDAGTFTNDKGAYSINAKSLPVTLVFSSVGYNAQEVTVTDASVKTDVSFVPNNALGQEVVVSATRVSQKIMESPVSIERVSAAAIRNAPAANFYDVVLALKGVDVTTSSLTFKTPTTRGFNSSGNARFNQLVDGMDNVAPGLNFSVGAIIGLSELDVDNIELLSGASSALYGPGGMNGTLLMTSKNPFKYQGLSFVVKTGIMHTDKQQRAAAPYHNWNLRWGKKVSEKFAFKTNFEFIQAKDWLGVDNRNYSRVGTLGAVKAGDRQTDPNYDGVNVYGDETSADIRGLIAGIGGQLVNNGLTTQSFINTLLAGGANNVSRTGYAEKDVVNPNTVNFKMSGSVHYKITPNTEAVIAGYWGTGNTIYTGSDRYSIINFKMGQYKVELNNKNWSLRAYTTQENSGETYNTTATSRLFNESWKKSVTTDAAGNPTPQASDWYVQYTQTYLGRLLAGATNIDAHNFARSIADVGRPLPGSAAFRTAYDEIRRRPIGDPKGGGRLVDKTDLYNYEGNYNLSHVTKSFADILVGVNYKKYVLNSAGTLFADFDGPIGIGEYGGYIQATKAIGERLKLTASGRYDKNDNFKGRFTPRVTALLKVKENNNIRLSYQSAYRFPTNQQQWIQLQVGSTLLVGGNKYFADKYKYATNPLYVAESVVPVGGGTPAPVVFTAAELKPEAVNSFEIGYKGLLAEKKLLIDVYGYFGQYQDFLGRINTFQTTTGIAADITNPSKRIGISVPNNSADKVKTYGFGFSVDYRLPSNFTVGANIASDVLKDVPTGFVAYFNAPKYKTNVTIANTGFGPKNRLGANVAYRWQQSYYYQGDFANGQLPDVHTLDAQISLKLPATKSMIKLGANNLLNQYYYNAIGNSQIGGLYYLSFGYNIY